MLKIQVSLGELVDKITILKIKLKFLSGQKKANVKNEYDLLNNELRNSSIIIRVDLIEDLQMTNQKLWELLDIASIPHICFPQNRPLAAQSR